MGGLKMVQPSEFLWHTFYESPQSPFHNHIRAATSAPRNKEGN